MKPELPKFLKKLRREITPQQREFTLNEVFAKYPLTNGDIWILLIQRLGTLTQHEQQRIIDTYKNLKELGDVSVGQIIKAADVADLTRDKLLARVCFNYDHAFDAQLRYQKAEQEMNDKKRESITWGSEFWRVEDWVHAEFEYDDRVFRDLDFDSRLNPKTQQPEDIYRVRRIGSTHLIVLRYLRDDYIKKVLPCLDKAEGIKPAALSEYFSPEKPHLTRLYL